MGAVALRIAAKNQENQKPWIPHFDFYFGRIDCCHDDAPDYDESQRSPDPHGNTHKTLAYFGNEFGLSPRQSVALLGGHTLGKARAKFSGFSGEWTAGKLSYKDSIYVLDNLYYRTLLEPRHIW